MSSIGVIGISTSSVFWRFTRGPSLGLGSAAGPPQSGKGVGKSGKHNAESTTQETQCR